MLTHPWFVRNELYDCVKTLQQFLVSILFSVLQPEILIFSFTSKCYCFTSRYWNGMSVFYIINVVCNGVLCTVILNKDLQMM